MLELSMLLLELEPSRVLPSADLDNKWMQSEEETTIDKCKQTQTCRVCTDHGR